MTDTNSKAQVTEKMVNAADSVLSRSRPGIPDEIIALAISAALAAQEKPEPGVVVKALRLEMRRTEGTDPVNTHGGLAVSITWELFVNGVVIMRDYDRFHWDVNPAKRALLAAAPPKGMQKLHDQLLVAPSPDLPEGEVTRKFNLGDHVHKVKGASWTGHVVGFYSTELTPIGYAVESSREKGSVQIYPEAALEFSTSPSPIDKGEVK